MPKKKLYTERKFYWRGRTWRLHKVIDKDYGDVKLDGSMGRIFSDKALIVYSGDIDPDLAIMTILHEAGHEMFPEWSVEPSDKSSSEIGVYERDCKSFLEALGVDLSPLIE